MEASKILSVDLIDLIFDGRNKAYGAYELRKTYSVRTRIALTGTIAVVALIFWGVTMAGSSKDKKIEYKIRPGIELATIPENKPPEKLPEPERKPEPEPVQTQQFTPPAIKPDEVVTQLLASQDDLDSSRIALETHVGVPDERIPEGPEEIDKGRGIIPGRDEEEEGPASFVDIPAKFTGNWENFLRRNLDAETPVNNGAGPGRYSVVVQFVVDKEGNVSEIKPLTNHGFGVEDEAVRVLKKATKWEPAIQNGHKVKAYHRQVIVFVVETD